jgi:DNA replication protein DnaC
MLACNTPGDQERRRHESVGSPTYADAILDRLVHNAHRLILKGESMRKTAAKRAGLDTPTGA